MKISSRTSASAPIPLEHAFRHFRFPRVISLIHPENRRSIAVAQRLRGAADGETELLGWRVLVYAYSPVR